MKKLILILSVFLFGCNTEQAEVESATWEAVPITDEFGEVKEGGSAIVGIFEGTMSDPSTESATLKVKILVQGETVSISLLEHGIQKATFKESSSLTLDLKTEEEVKSIDLFYFKGHIFEKEEGQIMEVLNNESNPIKALIKQGQTKYLFEIDPTGLKELLATI